MSNITLDNDGAGTLRTFLPMGESNGLVIYETRDMVKRSLESNLTISSIHLNSNATRIAGKLQQVVTETVDSTEVVSAQNQIKIDVVVSDDATIAQREELAFMLESLAAELHANIGSLTPVYL